VDDDEDESEKRHVSRERLARHLRRRGIAAEPKQLIGDIEVAALLLSHVADESADLLVMGGYGHSRLREMVLGGTTREILRPASDPECGIVCGVPCDVSLMIIIMAPHEILTVFSRRARSSLQVAGGFGLGPSTRQQSTELRRPGGSRPAESRPNSM
jgi:hypothetical protein